MTKVDKFIHFIFHEVDIPRKQIIFIAAIAGLSNGILLALINSAAEQAYNTQIENQLLIMYLLAFLLMIYCERYSQKMTIAAVEKSLQKIRFRLTKKVCQAELRFIEESGDISAYAPLLQGVNSISDSMRELVEVIRETLLLIVACLYLLWLSPPTFAVVLIFLITSIPIGIYYYQKTDSELEKMEVCEERFIEHFEAILAGFKELKVNHQERDALLLHIEKLSKSSRDRRISSNNYLMNEGVLSHITMYSLILVSILIIPQMMPETTETIHKITATILFILGPATLLAATLPGLSRTIHIISNLYKLEERLDNTNKSTLFSSSSSQTQSQYTHFKQISLTDVEFTYSDKNNKKLFHSGPFDLTIHTGELLFIVGGNGSGKSTLLKLLTGLYHPDSGILSLDEQPISSNNYSSYQSLFSIVFTDFYLFDQLYGLPNISDDEVNTWIKKLALAHKTTFKNGRFTNVDLSTGQRKRLAFIAAVLKNRPICIFDELAADQDPQFRRQFYEKILPELKAEGRTVIVVTHDDTYFKQSDRLIKLADGKIIFDSAAKI